MKAAIEILTVLCTTTEYGTDKITERYQGAVTQTYEGLELIYQESDNVEACLLITEHSVNLWRKGQVKSHMEFMVNHQTLHPYLTPEGAFDMGVLTKSMSSDIKTDSGKLELHYEILISGQKMAENHLKVMWKKSDPELN